MTIAFVSATPVEHEIYMSHPQMEQIMDSVGSMIKDLHDYPIDLQILFVVNDPENINEFSLAFSGSTLSLEFSPDGIEVEDFNDGDPVVLEVFERDQINAATTWLINQLNS